MATMPSYAAPKRKNPREEAMKRRLNATKQATLKAPAGAEEQDETVQKRKKVGY